MKKFILLCAVFSACATAAPRPRLIEPHQVIQAPDYLTDSAAAGDAIVSLSVIPIPDSNSQSTVQANLHLRDASGVYQSQGVLFSEIAEFPLQSVAMSSTVIALGMPSGLHVFRRNSAGVFVEVIVDGTLAAAGDKEELLDPGRFCLLDCIMNKGLIDNRQHFLRHRLGRRQKTSSQPGDRENSFANWPAHQILYSFRQRNFCHTARRPASPPARRV